MRTVYQYNELGERQTVGEFDEDASLYWDEPYVDVDNFKIGKVSGCPYAYERLWYARKHRDGGPRWVLESQESPDGSTFDSRVRYLTNAEAKKWMADAGIPNWQFVEVEE